jgi:hypothetical protein
VTTSYETITHITGSGIHLPDDVPLEAWFPTRKLFNEWVTDPDDANCPECLAKAATLVSTVETKVAATSFPADQAVAEWLIGAGRSGEYVFNSDTGEVEDNGIATSEWQWVRLNDGDLILGCFPQAWAYEAVEHMVQADFDRAQATNLLSIHKIEEE